MEVGMAAPTGLIQTASSALAAAKTGSAVGMKMLSKTLDNQDAMGVAMIKMMENSVNPAIGGNFDASA